MDCKKCGAEIPEESKVCPDCGEEMENKEIENAKPEKKPKKKLTEKQKKMVKVAACVVAVLVAISVIASAIWFSIFKGKLELANQLDRDWKGQSLTSLTDDYGYYELKDLTFGQADFGFEGHVSFNNGIYKFVVKSSKKVEIDGVTYKVKFEDRDGDKVDEFMVLEVKGDGNGRFVGEWKSRDQYYSYEFSEALMSYLEYGLEKAF